MSPFFANYSYKPTTSYAMGTVRSIVSKAEVQVDELKDLYRELSMDIVFSRVRMAKYYNFKRTRGSVLKEGDKAYLLRRNIKTTRPSGKLDYTKLGPFRIEKVLGKDNYELDLPREIRIWPRFHISVLEPAHKETPIQTNPPGIDPESQAPEYEVEKILDTRLVKPRHLQRRRREYLVKWKGYSDENN